MSSNRSKSKEEEILQRQHDIAMCRAAAAIESKLSSSNPKKPPPPTDTPKPRPVVGRTLSSLTGLPAKGSDKNPIMVSSNQNSQSTLKNARPKMKVETALAQARQRVTNSIQDTEKQVQRSQLKRPSTKRPSLRNQSTISSSINNISTKQTLHSNRAKGSLSSILLSNTTTAKYLSKDAPKLLKHYPKVEPNDYWKNLHAWDFLRELNDKIDENHTKRGKRKREDDTPKPIQSLPNTFSCHREYCALWSPLIMVETRAQLLSEAISDIPYWRSKPEKNPIRVRVEVRKKDLEGDNDVIGLVVKEVLGKYTDRTFMANDIVCLVREEKMIWDATKGIMDGKESSDGACCIVGHLEHTRRTIENLVVTISRKVWKQSGCREMTLLKIGCNITSLREFTALCRMDRLPLADYILCNKMNVEERSVGDEHATKTDNDNINEEQKRQAKKDILQKMGGPIALGKGFVDYARHKFNLSQLRGISASAAEYGDGGFTLVSNSIHIYLLLWNAFHANGNTRSKAHLVLERLALLISVNCRVIAHIHSN